MNNDEFLDGFRRGDRAAIQLFYQSLFPAVASFVRDYGGSEQHAQDVFQDAAVVAFQKSKAPDFLLTSKFSTWFIGIARNTWLTHRKKKSFAEVTIPNDAQFMVPDFSSDPDFLQAERGRLFFKAFQKLEPDCQALLQLFFQKIPMDEIAVRMGYASEGYARRRKHQCKQKLLDLIKNDPEFEELKNL